MENKVICQPKFMTIKEVRKKLKLSQKDFGKRLLVSRQTVCSWENGQYEMTLNLLQMKVLDELLRQIGKSFKDLPDTSADRHKKPLAYK